MDYRNMPLRKPIALWCTVFAGVMATVLTLIWAIQDRIPPGELVSIVIAFITVPPTAYMGTSVYQSVRMPNQGYQYQAPEYSGEDDGYETRRDSDSR